MSGDYSDRYDAFTAAYDLTAITPADQARAAALTLTDRLGRDCRDILDMLDIPAAMAVEPLPPRVRRERIYGHAGRIRGLRVGAR